MFIMMMVPFFIVYGKFKVDILLLLLFYYYCSLLFQEKTHRDAELQFREFGLSEFREGGNPQGLEKLTMTEWRRSQADPVLGGWRENELGVG